MKRKNNSNIDETRYRNALILIHDIGIGYDGYSPENAEQMKSLVDEFLHIALLALRPDRVVEPIERAMVNELEGNYRLNEQYNSENDHCIGVILKNAKCNIVKE